jgi:hypothetical protein
MATGNHTRYRGSSSAVELGPNCTVEQIGSLCRELSTDTTDVFARIEYFAGRSVALLVRAPSRPQTSVFLRRQAT